jgi:glucose-1-phosphate cytidylyltransferase
MADNPRPVRPAVAILCGGRGTRLQERSQSIPKPLVEIGGRPILWHVIQIYLAQGFRRFLLLTGYRSATIDAFAGQTDWPDGTEVRCLDTGEETPTGGRVYRAREELGDGTFCLTYADGVADVDLTALLEHHHRQRTAATMTVVRPQLPFGVAELDGDGLVKGFAEKPRSEHWINGGFLCLEPVVFESLGEDSVLEREPLAQLAAQQQLSAFRHEGFWECLDTYKDAVALNDLWREGRAPWKLWR